MMTNLQSSAFVAKTTQLLSSVARLRLLLVMLLTISVSAEVWGETTATLTLSSSKKFGTTSGSTLTDDKNNTWTCTGSAIQNTYNTTYKGQQFGTSKNAGNYTFTCTIAGATISSVKITAAAGSTSAKYSISVGGNSKYSGKLSKTSTTYGGTSASGSGEISISLQGSGTGAAVYLGSITVIYTTTSATKYTVTFSAGSNGTCSTTSLTETSAGAGVTLPDVTPNSGYRFLGWATTNSATTADAGTAGETYKPASNITLYAVYKQQCTITWLVDGNAAEGSPTTKVDKGGKVTTLPTTPTLDCSGKTFVGWSNEEVTDGNEPAALFTTAENSPAINANTTFYAVFATTSGGDGEITTTKTETFENQTSYSSESNWKQALTWSASESKIGVEWTTYYGKILASDDYVELRTYSDGVMGYIWTSQKVKGIKSIQFNGWCVNSTDKADMVVSYSTDNETWNELGTHIAGTASTSQSIIYTLPDYGVDKEYYISIDLQNATCPNSSNKKYRIDNIAFTFVEGSGTTYSDYTTSCSTETLVSVLPKIMNFWQSIFGVSLGYLRDKIRYRHVLGGIVVVSLHHRCTKNRFSSYQYVKDRFVGLCLFVWQTTERFFV